VTRVRYFEGQRLRAEDLRAEQEYLIALERRHNLAQHGPGIVRGLDAGEDWFEEAGVVRPGVAVDEEGRVLVLEQPTPAAELGEAWLVPCEAPLRRRGSCEPDRLAERLRVVTGELAPVEGAIALGGETLRYTSLTASQVRDPARRAVMQVGPATGRDRNGFAVSTTDAAGVLAPRIALDRLGTNDLLGTTTVAGYRASAEIALSTAETLFVRARRPGPQGARVRVRIRPGVTDDDGPGLRVQFFDGPVLSKDVLFLPDQDRAGGLKTFHSALVTVSLIRPFSVPMRFVLAVFGQFPDNEPPPPVPAQPPLEDVPLKLRGSGIDLVAWPQGEAKEEKKQVKGCVERLPEDAPIGQGPNGLSFIPMAEAPKGAPVPGLASVQSGTAEEPAEEFRIDLGEAIEGDTSVRLSAGSRDENGQFTDWMKVRGTSIVMMTHLAVTGQVRVAPLRADHTDPNFTALLVRSYIEGLKAAMDASESITLTFEQLPALIKTDEPWKYTVKVANSTGSAIAEKLLETMTPEGDDAPLSQAYGLNVEIAGGLSHSEEISHPANQVGPGMLKLEVEAHGKRGSVSWYAPDQPLQTLIPVHQSPAIDAAGIPQSVPKNQDWSWSFVVRNNAGVALTLVDAFIREGAGDPQPLQILAPNIPANGFALFEGDHAGIANDLDVVVTATVRWSDATDTALAASQTVSVADDLDVAVAGIEPVIDASWTYDLTVENQNKNDDITITALRHRIVSSAFDVGPELIPHSPEQVEPEDQKTFPNVEGIEFSEVVNEIDLTIEVDYERPGQPPFTFRKEIKGIDVDE
jgi:hypothetical protein